MFQSFPIEDVIDVPDWATDIWGLSVHIGTRQPRDNKWKQEKKNPFIFKGRVICADMGPNKTIKVLSWDV